MNKDETIVFEKILNEMGFNELDSLDRQIINKICNQYFISKFFKDYPNLKDSVITLDGIIIILIMEMFKHQLKTNTKCDKLIEQNNQIIELLQKIADK